MIDRIHELVRRAEAGETTLLDEARNIIAQCVIDKVDLDKTQMEQLCIRAGANSRKGPNEVESLLTWGPMISACADYVTEGTVAMRDGRVATPDGWDYHECEPDDLYANVSRLQSERLQAYVATLTDEEPSNDPERNPSEYDERFDQAVEEAIAEYLNKKGFPQLWQN